MKKIIVITTVVLFGCIFAASCDDGEKGKTEPMPDQSLAGSIIVPGYRMTAEGSFDGIALENYQLFKNQLHIYDISGTEVELSCFSTWDETKLDISIPVITVLGELYDVTFDFSSEDVTVTYDDVEYTSVGTTITGWIKRENAHQSTYVVPLYTCNIVINCDLDGKMLILNITSINAF